MKQPFLLNIIVPVYNEEAVLERFFSTLKKSIFKYNYKIIFIDDGSTDHSLELLMGFLAKDKSIEIIKLKRNFGQQNAIYTGLTCAKGDCAVVLDADLQDPPRYICDMVEKWQEGHKIVFAQRKSRSDNLIKKITAYFFYRGYKLLINRNSYLDTGDFYLLDKKVISNVVSIPESRFFLRGTIAKEALGSTSILVDRDPRILGKTKYSTKKMLKLAFHAFLQSKIKTKKKSKTDFIEKIFYASKK